jgi:hypothetical protein
MKYFVLLTIPFLLSCASQGNLNEPESTYPITVDIRVNGTDSVAFSGEYGNNSDTTEVSGFVPQGIDNYKEYKISIEDSLDEVFALFYKQQSSGQLKVSFYVDDHLESWDATSESFDTVYVTWKP